MSSTTVRRSNIRADGATRLHTAMPAEHHRGRNHEEIDGVYKNTKFTFYLTTLIGCPVEVLVKNGNRYEGIFKTFSPDVELVLECVHLVDVNNRDRTPTKDRVIETLILDFTDLVSFTAVNADTKYGETDSFTDSAISKAQVNGVGKELRELTPFVLDGSESGAIEQGLEESSSTGDWTPEKMFKHHEEKYGKKTNFNEEDYTTKLPSADTPDFHRKLAEAERVASEIEANPTSRRNTALENGDGGQDEESRFSAVVRGNQSTHTPNRYTPPQLRNRDKTDDSRPLSQSMRLNGRDTHSKTVHEKPKSTEEVKLTNLKKWNSNFNFKPKGDNSNSSTVSPEPAIKVDNKKETATEPGHAHIKSPVQSPPTKGPKVSSPTTADVVVPTKTQTVSTAPTTSPVQSSTAEVVVTQDEVKSVPEEQSKEEEKPAEPVKKSVLNPEAKEFVLNPEAKEFIFTPKVPAIPANAQHQNPHPPTYNKSPKEATVSVVEARQPKSQEMVTPAQVVGQPLINATHHNAPYPVMYLSHQTQGPPRVQRVASYSGNEGQPGQAHSMGPPHLIPTGYVANGMPGHVATIPQGIGGQQHGNVATVPATHNGQLHPHMQSQPHPPGPPPVLGASGPQAGQPMHHNNQPYPNQGTYNVYPVSAAQTGQQPTTATQPAPQPSPHNPSPSPAPMTHNASGLPYHNYPPPPAQQFYQATLGQHPVSQAPSYPPNQQVIYLQHAPVPGQFPHMYHQPYAGYPPPNFAPQQ